MAPRLWPTWLILRIGPMIERSCIAWLSACSLLAATRELLEAGAVLKDFLG